MWLYFTLANIAGRLSQSSPLMQNPRKLPTALTVLLCFLLMQAQWLPVAFAQQAATAPTPTPVAPTAVTHSSTTTTPLNLNLSSTQASLNAGGLLQSAHAGSAVIHTGTQTLTVTSGSSLTPAEYMAVYQVLNGGSQQLTLGANGSAVGGMVTLGSGFNQGLGSINIPQGVTAVDNFSSGSLALTGNFVNHGSFYAVSTNPAVTTANISAANILNLSGGLISSVLPASGLLGINGAISSLNLNLTALQNITNNGIISSSGALSMTAGAAISNITATAGVTAALQAVNNVNLYSSNITNSGLIASSLANVVLSGLTPADLLINNSAGTIQALQGAINIGNPQFAGNFNTSFTGGNVIANELNVFSGSGMADLNFNSLLATLNIHAGQAHVLTSNGTLDLGTLDLSGDPTFFNTNGNVIVSSPLSFSGQSLSIVASGNIISAAGAGVIDTSGTNGGQINLIAGANFTVSPSSSSSLLPGAGDTTSTLTVYGASVTGGKIDLTQGGGITSLTSQSTGGGGSGGNINLIAFNGTGVGAGSISLPSSVTIQAGGNGSGTNGTVNVIAGAAGGRAMSVGSINASGGADGTGGITVANSTPQLSSAITILNGAITSGSFSSSTTGVAGISTVGSLTANGAPISIVSGGQIAVGAINDAGIANGAKLNLNVAATAASPFSLGGGGANGTGAIIANATSATANGANLTVVSNGTGALNVSAANLSLAPGTSGTGATVSLTSGGNLLINGGLKADGTGSANGGSITLVSRGSSQFTVGAAATSNGVTGGLSANGGSTGGTGGTISITDNSSGITLSGGTVSASAQSGKGGTITLSTTSNLSINGGTLTANGGGSGSGNGGSINLTAQQFISGTTTNLIANGAAAGSGGSIAITGSSSSGVVPIGIGGFNIQADGGTTSGNGGSLMVRSAQNISADGNYISLNPLGANGNGGSLTMLTNAGNVFIANNLSLNGVGNGNGGTILVAASGTAVFDIESTASINGANGIISANAGSTGNGGSISFYNGGTMGITIALSQISLSGGGAAGAGNAGTLKVGESYNSYSSFYFNVSGTSNSSGTSAALNVVSGALALNGVNGGNGGTISFSSAGPLNFAANTTLSANGNGAGAGGSISLSGQTVNLGTNIVTLNANGGSSGNGGSVSVGASDNFLTKLSDINVGSAAGSFKISVTGGASGSASGNGGSITLTSMRNVTVDPAYALMGPLGNNGNGGSISLSGGGWFYNQVTYAMQYMPGNTLFSGSINANGVGNGNGGNVSLSSDSSTTLTINQGATVNGVSGTISANGGSVSGNGGGISLGNMLVGNSGTTVSIKSWSDVSVAASTGAAGGSGGSLTIGATFLAGIDIPTGTLSVNGTGPKGNGGSVDIQCNSSTFSGMTINANGSGTGNGGSIYLQTATSSISIDSVGSGGVTLSATSGASGGNGGSISIQAGVNLLVNTAYFKANPLGTNGNGASLLFVAANQNRFSNLGITTGNLYVNGSINANGVGTGNGGSIELNTYNTGTFTVASGTSSNGVNGSVSATAGASGGAGGSIQILNETYRQGAATDGGITISNPSLLAITATNGNGGTIEVAANGPVTIGAGTLSADASVNGDGGNVEVYAGSLTVTGGNLLLSANAAGTGDGGYIDVESKAAVTIGTGSGQISISATGGSSGSAKGDGGFFQFDSIGATIIGDAINMRPLGLNGAGGQIEADEFGTASGTFNLNGVGNGDGGWFMTYGSAGNNPVTVNATIHCDSGATGGEGGGIDIEPNTCPQVILGGTYTANGHDGDGYIYVENYNYDSVKKVVLPVTITVLSGALFQANSTGPDPNNRSAYIGFYADYIQVTGGGTATIQANSTGGIAAGEIDLNPFNAAGDLVIGKTNGFTIQISGGVQADGGYLYAAAGRNLTVDGTAITMSGGINNYQGQMQLEAGTNASTGQLNISNDLSMHNAGSGSGGDVLLAFKDTNPFIVGSAVTNSGVSGSILLNATGPGTGANLTIQDYNSSTPLNLQVNSSINTGSLNHSAFGTISLEQPGQPVSVTGTGSVIGVLQAHGSSVNVSLTGTGNEVQANDIAASAGNVILSMPGTGSSIFVVGGNPGIVATGTISITAPTFAAQAPVVSSANGNISITSDSVNYSSGGSVNAGTGTVTIAPMTNVALSVGNVQDFDGFYISQAELNNTTASTLVVGDSSKTGSFTIGGPINVSGSGAGAFNLVFNTGGIYNGTGQTITLGAKTLTINALGGGTTGNITGTGTTVNLTNSGLFTIDGTLNISGSGTIKMTANSGSGAGYTIGSGASVSAANVTLAADSTGNITNAGGTLIGTTIVLSSGSGSIGTSLNPMSTAASNLQANTTNAGNVFINQTGNVNLLASSAGTTSGTFSLVTSGSITTSGAVSGNQITLDASSALSSTVTLGAAVTGTSKVSIISGATITDSNGLANMSAPNLVLTSKFGNITLSNGYSASSSIQIFAPTGGVSSANTATGLNTGSLTVNSGAAGTSISATSATTLTATSTGAVSIVDTANSSITLVGGSGSSFAINANGINSGLTTSAPVSSANVSLRSGTAGISIGSGAELNATTLAANSTGAVSIIDTANSAITLNASSGSAFTFYASSIASGINAGGTLNSANINLTAGTGGINFTAPNSVNATSVTASSTGSVYLDDSSSTTVSLNASNSGTVAGNVFTLNATGAGITTTGLVSGYDVKLLANTAAASTVSLGANVTGNNSVTVKADSTISDTAGIAVNAPTITLSSANGSILLSGGYKAGTSISLSASNGAVSSSNTTTGLSTGNLILSAGTGGATIASTSATAITANSGGSINIGDSANSAITLQGSAASALTVTASASSSGLTTSGAFNATSVNLVAGSAGVNLSGTSSINATQIAVTTSGNVAIKDTASSAITLNTSSAGSGVSNTFTVTSTGADLIVGGTAAISGTTVTLNTPSANGVTVSTGGAINGTTINLNTGSSTINGSVSATGGLSVQSTGNLTVAGSGTYSSGTQTQFSTGAGKTMTISGSLTGTGVTSLATTGGTINITGTISSSTMSTDAASLTVAGGLSSSTGSLTLQNSAGNAFSITNNGTISSAGALSITTPSTLSITNNASISSSTTSLASGNLGLSITGAPGSSWSSTGGSTMSSTVGAVNISQDTLGGTVTGTAATSYSVTANTSALTIGNVSASGGAVSLTAANNTATVNGGAVISAQNNVTISGKTGVTVNAGASVTGGQLAAGLAALSTNLADFDMAGVTHTGAVSIQSSAGNVSIGNNVNAHSDGANVSVAAGGSITIGSGGSLFAQGGNVDIYAGTTATVSGGSIVGMARVVPGMPALTISGQSVPDFTGGGVAIYAGIAGANLNADLTKDSMNRSNAGYYYGSPGVVTTGSTLNYVPNGGYLSMQIKGAGILAVTGSTLTANGGVIDLDPPTNITLSNVSILAVEPGLAPPIVAALPATAASTGTAASTPAAPMALAGDFDNSIAVVQTAMTAANAVSAVSKLTPLDQTKIMSVAQIQPAGDMRQCVPAPIAPFAEADGWSVAAGSCQSFAVRGDRDTAIIGAGGSALSSTGDHNVTLVKGTMIAMTGKQGITISTGHGTSMALPADSSVMVQQTGSGVIRITQLTGDAGSVNINANGKTTTLATGAGKELLIADDSASDEELIPVDGVERVAISAAIKVQNVRIQQSSFNTKKMIEQNKFLNCNAGCYPQYVRNRLNRAKQQAMLESPSKHTADSGMKSRPVATTDSALRPVAYETPATSSAATHELLSMDTDVAIIKHAGATKFSILGKDSVKLEKGEMLVSANNAVTIRSGKFAAVIGRGSIVDISYRNGILQVRNLFDPSAGSVAVISSGHQVKVPLGGEALLADTDDRLELALNHDDTGRRSIKRTKLADGTGVMSCEVSFVSAIQQSELLNKLFSSGSEDDKNISGKIAKSAVALSVVTGRHGSFAPIRR